MLSKQKIKLIKSLQIKKFRQEHKLFLVQGKKNIQELLASSFEIKELFLLQELVQELNLKDEVCEIVSQKELDSISSIQTNSGGVALVQIPKEEKTSIQQDWIIMLDRVQDPGNLGTIIRIADWYGINKIICSKDSVDIYNPKVVNSTMGSFTRVDVSYSSLQDYLVTNNSPVYAALLEGDSIYELDKKKKGVILLGNESKGVSSDLIPFVTHKVSIPRIGGAESLNVAVASGIICDNLLRV